MHVLWKGWALWQEKLFQKKKYSAQKINYAFEFEVQKKRIWMLLCSQLYQAVEGNEGDG